MEKIWINVLNMSLTAAYCAGIVLCIRLCIRRFPKVYSYALWLVVFCRFAIPISLKSFYSLVRINSKAIQADVGLGQMPQITTGLGQIDDTANGLIAMALPQTNAVADINPLQFIVGAASWIWLLVATVLLCYGVVSYWLLKYRIRDAVCVEGNVYETELIQFPFAMGVLKPCIYLPQGLSNQERECIVNHEQVHLKRYDHLVKQLAFIIVCFHWFNPMAWISLAMMCRDMELSCDEQVLRKVSFDGGQRLLYKKEYAATLLSMAGGRRPQLSGPLLFGSGDVKSRIKNVLAYKQRGKFVTCVSVVVVAFIAVGLMGNKMPNAVQSGVVQSGIVQTEEINSAFEKAGHTYIYQIPEEYWAGIEGIDAGGKVYPIILGTDGVYDNLDGNMAAISATVYCLAEDGLKKLGEIFSWGTAYPLSYDKSGIYINGNHVGNRYIINTKTWELELAEGVEVIYDSNGGETFYYKSGDEVQVSDEKQFNAFFAAHSDSVVMNFEELQ